jgi:hypothetical protein
MIPLIILSIISASCTEAFSTNIPRSETFNTETFQVNFNNLEFATYDEMLDIIDSLEELDEYEIERRYSEHELEEIERFLILLARNGVQPESHEEQFLENDIEYLVSNDNKRESFYDK